MLGLIQLIILMMRVCCVFGILHQYHYKLVCSYWHTKAFVLICYRMYRTLTVFMQYSMV